MCKAIEDMRKHAREAGYEEGKKEACKALEDMRKHAREEGYEEGKKEVCKALEDMRKHAREAGYEEGKVLGVEEGYEEGKKEALTNNIKTMHSNGADSNLIAKLLGLDIEYVKKILA